MKHRLAALSLLTLGLLCTLPFAPASSQQAPDPNNTLVIELKTGRVLIKLRPDLAPGHVKRVKNLAKEGFYDGLTFHRVIPGFMAQTGDPEGTGAGGSKYVELKAEFSGAVRAAASVRRAPTSLIRPTAVLHLLRRAVRAATGQYTL
jgi:peptidylprolyl isomerase